jgi:glycine oxidase
MRIIVVGDGAIGLVTARQILSDFPESQVVLVAPTPRTGCASLAAAAMFNSFAEVDCSTFSSTIERAKWLFNRSATALWPELLRGLEKETGIGINYGFGTFVINNHVSDQLEDENFDAILGALEEFNEPYDLVSPRTISNYRPLATSRAGRAIYIPSEGWVNPADLLEALSRAVVNSGRCILVSEACEAVLSRNGSATGIRTVLGTVIEADVVFLAPGANFSQIVATSGLGDVFPRILYGAGCTAIFRTGSDNLSNCVRTPNRGLACGIYCAPRSADTTVLGASNFISTVPVNGPHLGSVYTLLKAAIEQINFDFHRAEFLGINFGWRPTCEDTVPLIGATVVQNLYVATGTKRDGLHCSPLIARCISSLVGRTETPCDISVFTPCRKPYRIYSRQDSVNTYVKHSMNANYQHDFKPAKNRMCQQLESMYRNQIEALHDKVGAVDWGIPPELVGVYQHGYLS